jgi:DnaK suppressor protein
MSGRQKAAHRRLLEQKKAQLSAILAQRDGIAIQERMADIMDEILMANDRDLAIDALHREAVLLAEVQLALDAIDNEEYGLCACCDERIAPRRLEAVPWARLCIRCQEQVDQVQAGSAVRSRVSFRRAA